MWHPLCVRSSTLSDLRMQTIERHGLACWMRRSCLRDLPIAGCVELLVALYNCILDGECQVERDLGRVLSESKEHTNLAIDGLSDLLMLATAGPKSPASFGDVATGSITEYTNNSLRLWRRVFGCRFGPYDSKGRTVRKPQPPPKEGTFVSVKRGVFAAAAARMKLHPSRKPIPQKMLGDVSFHCTPVGVLSQSSLCTPKHKRFLRKSDDKMEQASVAARCRQQRQSPFPKPMMRFSAPAFPGLDSARAIAFAQRAVQEGEAGLTAIAGRLSVQVGWDRCAGANLVVVDSIAPLFDGQAVDPHAGLTAADALFIVGFGKVVVQYGEWLRARCNPAELTASDTVCHKVGINRRAKLVFSSSLRNVDRETYRAVRKCCKADGSKWTMRQAMTADMAGQHG